MKKQLLRIKFNSGQLARFLDVLKSADDFVLQYKEGYIEGYLREEQLVLVCRDDQGRVDRIIFTDDAIVYYNSDNVM